jgi:hypothetical protein
MGIFDDMFHDVGAVVAGLVTAQPPSILAAVQLATRALLGDKHAGARIRAVSARSPHAQSVFGKIHRSLMEHPTFQHALRAVHLHRRPLPPSHPKAHVIRRGVQETMHAIDVAFPGFLRAANTAKREDARTMATGRLHGGVHGGPHSHHLGTWHPTPRRDHHHDLEEGIGWGGPFGWGADYLFDEREELGKVVSPDDEEPERARGHRGWQAD